MGGTEAFPNLGNHCAQPLCGQLDFLPFQCDSCEQVFCLEHRTCRSHSCPKANVKDVTVFICPVCAKAVKNVIGQDSNVTMQQHQQEGCDPSNYGKRTKKPKCPVMGCGQALTLSNRVRCRDCQKDVCLKHRFAPDHRCPVWIASNRKAARSAAKATPQGPDTKFMESFSRRSGTDCGTSTSISSGSSGSPHGQSYQETAHRVKAH